MKRERDRGHRKNGVCVYSGVREAWRVVLAGPVLHLEEIASLAQHSPLLSAVISMATSNLADVMHNTLKLNSAVRVFFFLFLSPYPWCQGASQQATVNWLLINLKCIAPLIKNVTTDDLSLKCIFYISTLQTQKLWREENWNGTPLQQTHLTKLCKTQTKARLENVNELLNLVTHTATTKTLRLSCSYLWVTGQRWGRREDGSSLQIECVN